MYKHVVHQRLCNFQTSSLPLVLWFSSSVHIYCISKNMNHLIVVVFLFLRQEILVTQTELVKNVFFDLFLHRCLLFHLQRMCYSSCKRWPHPSSFILLTPVRGDFLATDYERQVNSLRVLFTMGLTSFRDIFRKLPRTFLQFLDAIVDNNGFCIFIAHDYFISFYSVFQ